jgi:hypothetical protein
MSNCGTTPSTVLAVPDARAGSRLESCGLPATGDFPLFPAPFRTAWKTAVNGEDGGESNGRSDAVAGLGALLGDEFEMGIACMIGFRVRLSGKGIADGRP